jgi:hypothetical protein
MLNSRKPKKILEFLEGNAKMWIDRLNLLKQHEREQILWRTEICKTDCLLEGKCKYCGCSVPGKLYVKQSCNNGERFPDIMEEQEWQKWKTENNISIKK